MTISKNRHEDTLTIVVEGRLDTTTAPQLEVELKESLQGISSLVMDMSALEYISSAGLRVLLSAQKIMNNQGEMKVTGANESIMEIFEVTGFNDIFSFI